MFHLRWASLPSSRRAVPKRWNLWYKHAQVQSCMSLSEMPVTLAIIGKKKESMQGN